MFARCWRPFFVGAGLALGGCGAQPTISGMWKMDETSGDVYHLTLREDRTFAFGRVPGNEVIYGSYTFDPPTLALTRIGHDTPSKFDVLASRKNELHLRALGANDLYRYERLKFAQINKTPAPMTPAEARARSPEGLPAHLAKEQARSTHRAVLNNLRMLSAAADDYYLKNGVTKVAFEQLVGPGRFIKMLNQVGNETYPKTLEQGKPITASNVDGRDIVYNP
jgi:type IV pilus assembly protein PilA